MERPCHCKQQNIAMVTDEFVFPLSGKDHPKPKECVYLFVLVAVKADKCFDLAAQRLKTDLISPFRETPT